ncbi:hypothetical protein AK88_01670 [Plasmodium fragile]|uniref:Uncharacterized protein n=1 Tax=Plasmodium fragile TaxID=5857 RepID=A0A0D9QNE5_PLAFR|nr:uncharacterized protein AK88_01670 [Plasmodium fragile]KJP88590.1 hypothetical protein AK88_01670 [Plasmodium fragile]
MEVQTANKKGEYIDHLLGEFVYNRGKLKRKDIMNRMEYYIGILTNINLKIVHNKNYQVVHLVLEVLLTNEVHVEPMILDKILACLNLKQILQKNDKVKIKNVSNMLLLINRKSKNNLNATNLFNLLFEAVALLLEAFCEEDIYSVARRVDYTLGGGDQQQQQQEQRQQDDDDDDDDDDDEEDDDEEEEADYEDETDDTIDEPLTTPQQTRKRKRANGLRTSTTGESSQSSSEPNDSDTSNHATHSLKKLKKEDGSECWTQFPTNKYHNVARINDYVVYINSLFNLYFKNYKPMLNDVKIYAFYCNLFGLFAYVYDYIGYVEELAQRCHTNEEEESFTSSFESVVKNLSTLKGLIKKQIIISVENLSKGYFKSVYTSYMESKEELKVNYSFFLFKENEKMLEIMYIIINNVSNENPSFRFDPHGGDKLICPSANLHKSKRDKLIYFFKDNYHCNEKHPFLGVHKIRGCLKALATIMKCVFIKHPSANLAHVQTYFTLFLLIPHFELTMYGKNVKREYAKLFTFSTTTKENNLSRVNCSMQDSDAETPIDVKCSGESKLTIHKNAAAYFKSVHIKIAHSVCRFEEELNLNDDQQTHNNVYILIDYSKLIYKFLNYLNGKRNITKDTFLFVNMTYFIKYIFDCLTNAYFELMRTKTKSALRECIAEGPYSSSLLHPSQSFLRERMYIRGKPHLLLYDETFKNIFSTYPRGKIPHSDMNTLEQGDRESDGAELRVDVAKQKKKKKKKLMIYLNYLIYVNQMNLMTVIHFDVTLRTLVFSTLFNFAKGVSHQHGHSHTGNLNILSGYEATSRQATSRHAHAFPSHILTTVMTKYVHIFGVKGLFKFLHYYIVGNVNAPQDQPMRSIYFLLNCVVMDVFKRSVSKWVDQASTILGYFIEVYTYHVCKLGEALEAILHLRGEGSGGADGRNIVLSTCQPQHVENSFSRCNPVVSYPLIVQNVEALEYILCCFLKAIPKKNITQGLLPHMKEIACVHLTKLKNEVIFNEKLAKGNVDNTKFAHASCKFYVLYFFNYSLSRVAMYSLLHMEIQNDQLLCHASIQHMVAMLQTSFPTIEPMYEVCIKEDSLHTFFAILQLILQTLFFFVSLAELRVIDLDRLAEHLNQVLRVLKKNALAEYPYPVKKKICRQIAKFFIYNHAFLVATFRGREQTIEAIYQEFTKLLFVDIAILKNEQNYEFLFDYFFIIRENKMACELLKELFSLHFILILGNMEKGSFEAKLQGRGNGAHDEWDMRPGEEAFLSSRARALVRRNRTLSSENHKWYEMLNVKRKLGSINGSNACRGPFHQFEESKMMSVFSGRRKNNQLVVSRLRSKFNREDADTPNVDVCILSNIFPFFNGIDKVQDNLYILLCKICSSFSNYNIYSEHILINILISFCENLGGKDSPKLRLSDLFHFLKLSFQLIQKQKEYWTCGAFKTNKNVLVLKLLFHIFFLYINQWAADATSKGGINKNEQGEDTATDMQKIAIESSPGRRRKKKPGASSSQGKARKVKICFVFFIKYFLLMYELVMSRGEQEEEGATATLTEDHVAYLTSHIRGGGSRGVSSEEVHTGLTHGEGTNDICTMLSKLKHFIQTLLSSGGDATSCDRTNGITNAGSHAATTPRMNALFLDMIEHVFVSFLLRHNFWEESSSAAVIQVVDALRGLQVEQVLSTANEKYSTFAYSILALKIFNVANKSGARNTSIRISADGGKHEVKDEEGEKLMGVTPAEKQKKKRRKSSRRKDDMAMDEESLLLFFKLFLPPNQRNDIHYNNSESSTPWQGGVKPTSLQLYDFLYHYNRVLVQCPDEHSVHICIKFQHVIKNICTLFSYSSDDVKNVLTYVQEKVQTGYSGAEAENCLYHFNMHIITLIFVISHNKEFCSDIILQSRRPTDSSSFISLYLLLMRHVQKYLDDNEVVMKRSSSVLFLLIHLIYKLSQLFVFFFVRLKAQTRDGSYSNLLGFVSNYCSLLIKAMDLLKNRIRSSNDGAVPSPGKDFITHFYILNNCGLFERKKFYLYLLSHQLFVLLYEFFNIQKNELVVKSKRTLIEVAKKGGYAINFFCSYLDSILYLDSRMNKLLLRNANFLVTFLRSNKGSLNLPPIAFPIVIKIVDMYEFISKTNSMGEDEYEEKKFLKGIFQITLSLLENSSIQFCYTSLTDRKREIFNALSG